MIRVICILSALMALMGCNKPDPNPELKDPIYADLNNLKTSAQQAVLAEKKALEGFEQELKDVVPQTGQIKYAQKRVNESREKINRLEQEAKFYELKVESRKREASIAYQLAFRKGESWPDPKEFAAYEAQKRIREGAKTWDSRKRVKAYADSMAKPTLPDKAH